MWTKERVYRMEKEILDYINNYINEVKIDCIGKEYKEEIDKIIDNEYEGQWLVSKTNGIQGVLLLNSQEEKIVIVADNERAVRDLMRKLSKVKNYRFYFDTEFKHIIQEYIITVPYENQSGLLDSKKNPIVAQFREASTLSGRLKNGIFVVEGALLVKRALIDNQLIENVVYSAEKMDQSVEEIIDLCREKEVSCYRATPGIMSSMTGTHPTPEIICSIRIRVCDENQLVISKRKNFYIILDGISNPDNLGIIVRTADAAGVNGVILLSNSTHFLNKNAIRGGRGAVGKIPIYMVENDKKLFEKLADEEFKIIGTSAKFDSCRFYDVDYEYKNIAVVIGNESAGIRKEILELCTDYIKIPMVEGQSSLNIAVASALIMYEYVRNNS